MTTGPTEVSTGFGPLAGLCRKSGSRGLRQRDCNAGRSLLRVQEESPRFLLHPQPCPTLATLRADLPGRYDERMPEAFDLPISEYAFPGPLRDQLVTAILSGEKTATTSLVVGYEREREPLPQVGDRAVVIDSTGEAVCIEEIVEVRVVRLADVDLAHAIAEGEGFTTVADWRTGHEEFWHSSEFRAEMDDADFTVDDDTQTVLVRFRIEPLPRLV